MLKFGRFWLKERPDIAKPIRQNVLPMHNLFFFEASSHLMAGAQQILGVFLGPHTRSAIASHPKIDLEGVRSQNPIQPDQALSVP